MKPKPGFDTIRKEEKNMKKLIALLLALVMVLTLAACGGKNEEKRWR